LVYYRYDGIDAYELPSGGVELLVTKDQRISTQKIDPGGYVTQIEAAAILQPPVTRVAIWQGVNKGKLKAHTIEGVSHISLQTLRKFAAKHGYKFTKGPPPGSR
jgi:hypothetical protein